MRFYIISAERKELRPEVNKAYTEELASKLWRDFPHFTRVDGKYKGDSETSFLVNETGPQAQAKLLQYAKEYGQECILYVDDNRAAFFMYAGGHMERIGTWTEVESVEGLEGYTIIVETAFTIKETEL